MKITENGKNMIKQFEGLRLYVYQGEHDKVGLYTCGYGHTGNDVQKLGLGTPITLQQANNFLDKDLETFEKHINKYNDKYNFTQNQFDALVSFAFNIGSIAQLTNNKQRTKEEIRQYMLNYCNSCGHFVEGLLTRRMTEAVYFDTGKTTGWVKYNNKWYYIDNCIRTKNKWIQDNGKWCYIAENSICAKNCWTVYKGDKYYLKDDYYMAENEILSIGGKIYKFDTDGKII